MKAPFDSPDPLYEESLFDEDDLECIDLICDRFAKEWNANHNARLEDYLCHGTDTRRDVLLRELVMTEIALKDACGQTLIASTYRERFASDWPLLYDLFVKKSAAEDRAHGEVFSETRVTPNRWSTIHRSDLGSPATQDAHATSPSWPKLPGYVILGELGRGGMGVVYKARDLRLNRLVALKVILSGEFASAAIVARFHAEAEAAARLHHVGIVQVYDVGCYQGRHFFTQEFVDGGTLDTFTDHKPLPATLAVQLMKAMARSIHYAHQQGVVHRDLKPANVLLGDATAGAADSSISSLVVRSTTGGLVFSRNDHGAVPVNMLLAPKITDFGLAKCLNDERQHTVTGAVMGSLSYMAPEQAAGEVGKVGPLADVYALGAILYFLLTGRPPLQGATSIETLTLVQNEQPVPPRQLQPKLPADIDTICLKCLDKSPSRRYASAEALADDLRRFLEHKPIVARPISVVERTWRLCRRNRMMAFLIAVLILSIVADFFIVSWKWREADRLNMELLRSRAQIAQERDVVAQREAALVLQKQRELAEAAPLALDDWHHYALLQLKTGDVDGYRRTCHSLLEKFDGTEVAPRIASAIGWTCAVGPCDTRDAETALLLLQRASTAESATLPEKSSPDAASDSLVKSVEFVMSTEGERVLPPSRTILAGLLYRAERYEEAIERLDEAAPVDSGDTRELASLFLAMSHHELGHTGTARECLGTRSVQIDDTDSPQRLEIEILRSQAVELIQ